MAVRTPIGPGVDAFASESASGMALPFLPTLVVAVALAVGSMICEAEPPAPRAAPPAAMAPGRSREAKTPIAPVATSAMPAQRPASLAFANPFPTMPIPLALAARFDASQWPAAPRLASASRVRPGCPGARCAVAAGASSPHRAEPARIAATVEPQAPGGGAVGVAAGRSTEAKSEADGGLGDALPFAPAIKAIARAGDFVDVRTAAVGREAVAMSDAVVDLLGRMR